MSARRCLVLIVFQSLLYTLAWRPADAPLATQWSRDVHPDQIPEYPRPELYRDFSSWGHLNGLWEVDFTVKNLTNPPFAQPLRWQILVPYPVESPLSGLRKLTTHQHVFYRRNFSRSFFHCKNRTILHFEAVDWNTTLWVNGRALGSHLGGFDPFSFELTEALLGLDSDAEVELIVGVYDPTNTAGSNAPIGKQNVAAFYKRSGSDYLPTTGIWQTVWYECVGDMFFFDFIPVPQVQSPMFISRKGLALEAVGGVSSVTFNFNISSLLISSPQVPMSMSVVIIVNHPNGTEIGMAACSMPCTRATVQIPAGMLMLWSPASPAIYTFMGTLAGTWQEGARETLLDIVRGHFVMRHTSVDLDSAGVPRPMLNGEFVYTIAPLDQGIWPDGAYTAPNDKALLYDLQTLKQLGYNAVRKHMKVEPRRWYYYADLLGIMVWQDIVAPNRHSLTTDTMASNQLREGLALVRARQQFGCIMQWVVFNENWGLYGRPRSDLSRAVRAVRQADLAYIEGSGRLINACTGCDAGGIGDVIDIHHYPAPGVPLEYNATPGHLMYAANGEFGSIWMALNGHEWDKGHCWGYAAASNSSSLASLYERYAIAIMDMIKAKGLSASVYSTLADTETECDGVLSYDRVVKPDVKRWRTVNENIIAAAAATESQSATVIAFEKAIYL